MIIFTSFYIKNMHQENIIKSIDCVESKYTYTKRGHFKKVTEQFQDPQGTNIDQKVYNIIFQEQKKHGIKNLTTDHIFLFLLENKLTEHHKDIKLIYSTITKKDPPNILSYEN